jgi:hypothetical protein
MMGEDKYLSERKYLAIGLSADTFAQWESLGLAKMRSAGFTLD